MGTHGSSRPHHVVIVAFGPADVTRDARRRAHRLVAEGGAITVVAAHRGARPDAETPIGTDGLRAVLDTADIPTLVLHDDTLIGRDGVGALMRAWQATGRPAVPWSDVPDTDHHIDDPIPVDDDARMRLARRLPLRGGRAATSRPICVLATSRELHERSDRFMTLADAAWSDPELEVVVAAKALAHHRGVCVLTSAPPPGPDDGPLLVASMIVRDEAPVLPDCLASLDGLVDRVEVCDTGSTDDTVAIAESFGAHVSHRAWREDFAWARNQVLDLCRDAVYVLQIDADERVCCDDPKAVRRDLAVLADSARVLSLSIDNIDTRGRAASTHEAPRIIRPDRMIYRGALHERPFATDGTTPRVLHLRSLHLEHLGYQIEMFAERGKAQRNVAISRRAYEQTPTWETTFDYARSLSNLGDAGREQMDELLHEVLRYGDDVPITVRAWALCALGKHAHVRGEDDTAVDLAQQALHLVPTDPAAGALLAAAAERLGRGDLILQQRGARRSRVSPKPLMMLSHERARIAGAEVGALLELGATDDAYDEAAAALEADPAHFAAWPALVRSVAGAPDADVVDDLLVTAALRDATGGCIDAIGRELPPARAAGLCVRYLAAGGTDPLAVRNGLASALVAGDTAVIHDLLPDAHRLDPAVLEHLASAAAKRGMELQSESLATLAALPRRRFVVCGAGRSGTGHTAKALTALGHPCGHEAVFNPRRHAPVFGPLQGDSSWLALPFLDDLPDDAVIFHQVREPLQVLRSLVGIHMLTAPSAYLDFIAEHSPEVVDQPDEVSRCMAYWVVWNRTLLRHADGARPYVQYRVEDLTSEAFSELTTILGSVQPVEVVRRRLEAVPDRYNTRRRDETITMASLPSGALRDELFALAAEFGYQLAVA